MKGKVSLCGVKIVITVVWVFLAKLLHLECLCAIFSKTAIFYFIFTKAKFDLFWKEKKKLYIYIYNIIIYVMVKTMWPPDYHHNGFAATHALGHIIYIFWIQKLETLKGLNQEPNNV